MCRESFFANCRVRGGYSGVATFCRAASCVPVAALDGFTGACTLCLSNQFARLMHCLASSLGACMLPCPSPRERHVRPMHCPASMKGAQPRQSLCAGRHGDGGAAGSQSRLLCAGLLSQSQAKPKDLPPSTPAQEALSNPCSELFERLATALDIVSLPDDGSHNACRLLGCVVLGHHGSLLMSQDYLHSLSAAAWWEGSCVSLCYGTLHASPALIL